jgi:DHA2 family multidrug resistance protein-like MFS transporter
LCLAAIGGVVFAIKQLAAQGWQSGPVAAGLVGLGAGVLFVRRQRHVADPLLDLVLLRQSAVARAIGVNCIAQFALLGNAVLLTTYLQMVLGLSALRAALWSLAPTVVVGMVVPAVAALAGRIGRPRTMSAGLGCATVGAVELLWAGADSPVWVALAGATVLAAGIVSVTMVVADQVTAVAPADRAGSAAALVETSSELSGALGMAVLGSVLTASYRAHLHGVSAPTGIGSATLARLHAGLADTLSAVPTVDPGAGRWLLDTARAGQVAGMHLAYGALIVILLAGIALASRGAR